ncbi:MAG: hypothetical protein AAGA88_05525 [Pseudomonadota bacterium]
MHWSIEFSPTLPIVVIAVVAILIAIPAFFALVSRNRGAMFRAIAGIALLLALLNPSIRQEDRETVPSTVAVIVDKTGSQVLSGRDEIAEDVALDMLEKLERIPDIIAKRIDVTDDAAGETGSQVYSALEQALASLPADEVSGAIIVSDGLAHDIPEDVDGVELTAPVHGLITGAPNEMDRRVVLQRSPRYGIVGESQDVIFRIEDEGAPAQDVRGLVDVIIAVDGETVGVERVVVGQDATVPIELTHAGANVVTLEAAPLDGEITELNNRAVLSIEGVRENLRVLLVSGEPHSGERTWRNLLKSDASVDLVHFTILRPPEKQDGTPINQLSLIAFPTRELFSEKIEDFDLIIFDRYQRRGVLPLIYFDNIARYVENGGAVLIASGPEYGTARSLYRTPLATILPAEPTGTTIEAPFTPIPTEAGERHPVTRNLPGGAVEPPDWSRWFRVVEANSTLGTTIMDAGELGPLLILDRLGEGRVALMLSDHAWLWARGFEGGGPHVPLLRRLSHWLMAEPELEEERITLRRAGDQLIVDRQTMEDAPEPIVLTGPDGQDQILNPSEIEAGLWRATSSLMGSGIYRAVSGEIRTLASIGPPNPKEWESVISTEDRILPLSEHTGGSVQRVSSTSTPRIVPVSAGSRYTGRNWIGVERPEKFIVTGVNDIPLFAGFLGLALLAAALGSTWYREGR